MSSDEEEEILRALADNSSLGRVLQVIRSILGDIVRGFVDAHKLLIDQRLGKNLLSTGQLFCKQAINSNVETWLDIDPEALDIGNCLISIAESILNNTLSKKKSVGPRYGHDTFAGADSFAWVT
jgi:hypothetical protein